VSGGRQMADYLAGELEAVGPIEIKRFFGGWSLRSRGEQFAIVMDTLYLRVGGDLRASLERAGGRPFTYQAKGKTVSVGRYIYRSPISTSTTDPSWCRTRRQRSTISGARPERSHRSPGRRRALRRVSARTNSITDSSSERDAPSAWSSRRRRSRSGP